MRILILRFRLLGDIILTTPAVKLLRKHFPDAGIDYLVEPEWRGLVEGFPCINDVIVYDRVLMKKAPHEHIGFMTEMRKRHYDVAIDFHGGPRSGVVTRATGAPLRIGYTGPQSIFFYNCRIKRNLRGFRFHSVMQQIRLLEPLGIHPGEMVPAVDMASPGEDSQSLVATLLRRAKESGYSGLASVHIPPQNSFRNWGRDRVAAVAEGLAMRGLQPIFLGAEDSASLADDVSDSLQKAAVPVVGKTSVLDLRAIIAASRIFVGADSGPMHIAATTATPIVALFGPNLPRISGPWSSRATIIEENLECRPCDQRRCIFGDHRCYGRIDSRRILEAVDSRLEKHMEKVEPAAFLPAWLYGDPACVV